MDTLRFFIKCIFLEIKNLIQSKFDFFMIVIAPILTVVLLYWILSAQQLTKIPIAVIDYDNSDLSRSLISFLDASPALKVVISDKNIIQSQAKMRNGKIAAIVSIDKNFSQDIKNSRQAKVVLQHNAHQYSVSNTVQNSVRSVVMTMAAGIKMQIANKRGQAKQLGLDRVEPIRVKLQALFNPTLNFAQMLVTSLIFAVFHILAITSGADFVGRLFAYSVLPQWLENTQHKLIKIILKLAALMFVCTLPIFVIGSICLIVFNLTSINPQQGAVFSVILAMVPFLWLSFIIGMLFAAITQSRRLGLSASAFYAAPAFAFSGVSFPVIAMPKAAAFWASLSPFMHFSKILTQQLQLLLPPSSIIFSSTAMLLLAILLLFLTALLLRKNVDKTTLWQNRL